MKYFVYIILIAILSHATVDASDKCTVNGKIIDSKTNEPIAGATIRLEKTPFGAISKGNGEFLIQNIPAGNYNLIISFIGYEISEQKVFLNSGESLTVKKSIKSQPLRTEEIVVSANKRIQAVQDVPVTTAVIDSRSLQERNIVKADEALQYISGVNLIGDQVSIRGSSGFAYGVGSRVAFLIDGMPVLSGDQGDIKFDALPIFNIERIEIVKGAGSALYGTGALGGVINLITKEPTELAEYKIRTFAGIYTKPNYEEWQYRDNLTSFAGFDAGFSQKTGNLGITLSGGTKRDESYTLYDDSFRWNLFSKLKYNFSNSVSLSLLGSFATEDKAEWVYWNSLDSATRPPTGTDMNTRINSSKLTLNADLQYIFDNGDFLDYKSGWYSTDFQNNLKTDNSEYRTSKANSYYNEITLNNRLGEKFLLTYGLNHSLNTVDASIYGKKDQNIFALYFQGEDRLFDVLTVTIGARADYERIENEKSNFEFSPKLGVSYASPFGAKFRFSVGKGFRAPSVAEKFATIDYNGIAVKSNADLLPEHSWSYEIGGNYDFQFLGSDFYFDASCFLNEFYDMIEPQFDSTGAIRFQNITRARIIGLEANMRVLIIKYFGIETALTWMDPQDIILHETLKYRSKIMWTSGIFVPLGFAELQADYRYFSNVDNIDSRLVNLIKDSDARVPVHVLDARLLFRFDKMFNVPLTASINVKNLLNYYYLRMVGNLAPTRSISLQLEGKF